MGRAYICITRTDLTNVELQVLDLFPNTSLMVPAQGPGRGQTGYVEHIMDFDQVNTTNPGDGSRTLDVSTHGLAAYLLDNVENVGGNAKSLTDSKCSHLFFALMARMGVGATMTLADIDAEIATVLGAPGSGLMTGMSTGSVEEVMRILAGEVYRVPQGALVATAGNGFPNALGVHTRLGYFLEPPVMVTPGCSVHGRSFLSPIASRFPVQTGHHDWAYRAPRVFIETPDMARSMIGGVLGKLTRGDFQFFNPKFNYGVTMGPGVDPAHDAIAFNRTAIKAPPDPLAYQARGVVVYDKDGNLLI